MLNAGASVQIHFRGSSLDLAIVPGVTHGRLRVRVVDGMGTPSSSAPERLVDLQSGAVSVEVVGRSVRDTAQHTRTAEITVDDGSALALDSITVAYSRSYVTVLIAAAVGFTALSTSALLSRLWRNVTTLTT
jgi:hypothetical protein